MINLILFLVVLAGGAWGYKNALGIFIFSLIGTGIYLYHLLLKKAKKKGGLPNPEKYKIELRLLLLGIAMTLALWSGLLALGVPKGFALPIGLLSFWCAIVANGSLQKNHGIEPAEELGIASMMAISLLTFFLGIYLPVSKSSYVPNETDVMVFVGYSCLFAVSNFCFLLSMKKQKININQENHREKISRLIKDWLNVLGWSFLALILCLASSFLMSVFYSALSVGFCILMGFITLGFLQLSSNMPIPFARIKALGCLIIICLALEVVVIKWGVFNPGNILTDIRAREGYHLVADSKKRLQQTVKTIGEKMDEVTLNMPSLNRSASDSTSARTIAPPDNSGSIIMSAERLLLMELADVNLPEGKLPDKVVYITKNCLELDFAEELRETFGERLILVEGEEKGTGNYISIFTAKQFSSFHFFSENSFWLYFGGEKGRMRVKGPQKEKGKIFRFRDKGDKEIGCRRIESDTLVVFFYF